MSGNGGSPLRDDLASAARRDATSSPWAWNRHFWSTCTVSPSPATAAGDVAIHNDASLCVDDYTNLFHSDETTNQTPIVYVGTVALAQFVRDVLPHISRPFVLCNGMSDPGPAHALGGVPAAAALAGHPRLLAWWVEMHDFECSMPIEPMASGDGDGETFGAAAIPLAPSSVARSGAQKQCGACAICTKVRAIPVGLDFHTLAYKPTDRPQWGPAAPAPQQFIDLARAASLSTHEDPRVYVHFGWFTKERRAVMKLIRGNPAFHCDGDRHVPREELWRRMGRHRWVLCLQGGGLDCHRTWEALALGCGVVIEDLPFLRELLELDGERHMAVKSDPPRGSGVKRDRRDSTPVDPAAGRDGSSLHTQEWVSNLPGFNLVFRRDWPIACVAAPSGADALSPDLDLRASAKQQWRALSQERLDEAWEAADAQKQALLTQTASSEGYVTRDAASSSDSVRNTLASAGPSDDASAAGGNVDARGHYPAITTTVHLPAVLSAAFWKERIVASASTGSANAL